jgi:hypothetical protein
MVDDLQDKTELRSYGFSHRGSGFCGDSWSFHQKHGAPVPYFRRDINQIYFLDEN